MGALLTSLLQNAGRAGNDYAEGKNANLEQQQKLAQFKQQKQEIQQRLAQGAAPQVVHSYRGQDGKVRNIVRDPLSGKLTEQVAEGAGTELSPEQQKMADAEKALGRPLSPQEKEILLGVAAKPTANKAKYVDLKQDTNGKWFGLNTETQKMEEVPAAEGFKPKVTTAASKVNPIITAQIGKPPDPSAYPKGEDDPIYKAKAKQWGVQAEAVTNRMAQQRGVGYNMSRPSGYVTPDGELVTATAGEAMAKGYVPSAPAFNAMSKQAQFQEMNNASGKLRGAINALEPGDAFSADQVAKLKLASESQDAGVFSSVVGNMASSTLNEHQQDYLIWLQQMGERILSLRNVAGMGQGAQDLRAAIRATLPNISSGSKQFALKRLDAVDNQINLLQKGIPKVSGITGNQNQPPPGAKIIKWEDVK